MTERRSPVNTSSGPVPIGSVPPVGRVPQKMHAQVVRQSRYGEPRTAFAAEVVDVPPIGPDEVLIAVMAAGINYNNVWAARGYPVDQIAALRYFALDGTDHESHRAQARMIRRYIYWRNRNAHDKTLRELVKRANVA